MAGSPFDRAACTSMWHLFFGPQSERPQHREPRVAKAREICAGCACRRECLQFALELGVVDGVWAGVNMEMLNGRNEVDRDIERDLLAAAKLELLECGTPETPSEALWPGTSAA